MEPGATTGDLSMVCLTPVTTVYYSIMGQTPTVYFGPWILSCKDISGHRYLMLNSQVPSNIPGRTDSLIESLSHFDRAFETRWFRSSFMDPIWTTPLPTGRCLNQNTGSRNPQLRDQYNARQDEGRYSRQDDGRYSRPEDRPYSHVDDGRNKRQKLWEVEEYEIPTLSTKVLRWNALLPSH